MIDAMLAAVNALWPLQEKDAGEYRTAKVNGMTFTIRCMEARGLGNVSVMHGSGFFGLMQMDTLVINPFERDMALFSYDRIHAMGNDTLFLEMYDTRLNRGALPDTLQKVLDENADLPETSYDPNWYDDIKLCCTKRKGKKEQAARFDKMTEAYLNGYLRLCREAPSCARTEKRKAASYYTEGLLTHGGPSTDQFVKAKGRSYTEGLFRNVLFGTGTPE